MASIMGVSPSASPAIELAQHHLVPPTPLSFHHEPTSPFLCDGSEGRMRLRRVAFNAHYLSRGSDLLPRSRRFPHRDPAPIQYGKDVSLPRGRKTPVVVAYPATPLVTSRVRFCVSTAGSIIVSAVTCAVICLVDFTHTELVNGSYCLRMNSVTSR